MPDHWYNIEGCLSKYRDIKATEAWFARAHVELNTAEFAKLSERLLIWLSESPAFDDLSEAIFQLLNKCDLAIFHAAKRA
jgi:hypothetical protein